MHAARRNIKWIDGGDNERQSGKHTLSEGNNQFLRFNMVSAVWQTMPCTHTRKQTHMSAAIKRSEYKFLFLVILMMAT